MKSIAESICIMTPLTMLSIRAGGMFGFCERAVGEGKPEVFFRQSERAIDMQLGNEPLYLGTGRWNCPSEPPDVECSPCRVSFHIENRGRSEVKLAPL